MGTSKSWKRIPRSGPLGVGSPTLEIELLAFRCVVAWAIGIEARLMQPLHAFAERLLPSGLTIQLQLDGTASAVPIRPASDRVRDHILGEKHPAGVVLLDWIQRVDRRGGGQGV